ncbi:MAG: M1 family metallopeptidase [Chthoniobacterales bacterium]
MRFVFAFLGLVSLTLVSGCGPKEEVSNGATPAAQLPAADAPSSAPRAKVTTQLPTTVRPTHYAISVVPDAANLRFAGTVAVDVDVLEATDTITVNAADLAFQSVAVADAQQKALQGKVTVDASKETATFAFPSKLPAGPHVLTVNYTGIISTHATGLFALDYDAPEGRKRALYTQFEAADARRFFPSWDEPNFRTPYDLRVTILSGQSAVSNMPEAAREEKPDGNVEVRFATTPPMSSYLLFLGVGEFDRITKDAAGTQVGVVAKKGDGEKGRFALDGAAQILPYYNDYFGERFPLPKLDNVAGPGSSQFFGAMENWGAIFSFESILLNDPSITSESKLQSIFSVAAHEMAHQWFGDLVTMAWWNDLWLNEGFASWMSTKATNALHPEWEPLLGRIGGRESAMALDSVSTTHPIVQTVATVEQISQAFDSITYRKGEAVITMLEDYVGEEVWRQGVRDYIATYRLKNTLTDNLWEKVEHAAGKPVTAIAHDFTLQPGVPMIRVEATECRDGNTNVTLRQEEFSREDPNKAPGKWRVPVIASTVAGNEVRTLITGGTGTISVPGCEPLIVNSGQTGYYRTLYPPALFERLKGVYPQLKPVDQLGLLADNWALGLAGYEPAPAALDLLDAIPADANTKLWAQAAALLDDLFERARGDAHARETIGRYASAKLRPVLDRLGWEARAGEKPNDAVLRSEVIAALGKFGDPAVVAEANRRYTTGDASAKSGPLRTTIIGVVAAHTDAALWERLHNEARAETKPLVRTQLYRSLGVAEDEALARQALALSLTDEAGVTNNSQIVSAVAEVHPDLALNLALENREKVGALVDVSSRSRFIPGLATRSADPAAIGKLQQYADEFMTPQSPRAADVAIASIRDRIRVRETRMPQLVQWFEARSR